ncbi:hypothetical protein RYX36_006124 [Vicia faba]
MEMNVQIFQRESGVEKSLGCHGKFFEGSVKKFRHSASKVELRRNRSRMED